LIVSESLVISALRHSIINESTRKSSELRIDVPITSPRFIDNHHTRIGKNTVSYKMLKDASGIELAASRNRAANR